MEKWYVIFFVTFGLLFVVVPLLFVEKRITPVKIAIALIFFILISMLLSAIISIGGECTFTQSILLIERCGYSIVMPPKVIMTTNSMAFLLLVLFLISLVKETVLRIVKSNK